MTTADQIRALADTGTPADRWRIQQGHNGSNWIDAGEYDEVLQPAPVDCMAYCYGGTSQIELSDADAAKIVAAVNALPALAFYAAIREVHTQAPSEATRDALDKAWDALVEALGVTP